MNNVYALGFNPNCSLHTTELKICDASQQSAAVLKTERLYSLTCTQEKMVFEKASIKSKRSWKKNLFSVAAMIVLGVVTGVVLGNWYKDYVSSQTFDYSNYVIADYEIDTLAVLNGATGKNYTNVEDFGGYGNLAAMLHAQGKSPASLSAIENTAIAQYVATTASKYYVVGVGLIDTIVKQPFSSIKSFDGDQYVVESISSGSVMGSRLDVAVKAITEVSNPGTNIVYKLKEGTIPVSDERGVFSATYTPTAEKYSDGEFIELNGSPTNRLLPYIVSDKTVLQKGTTSAQLDSFNGQEVYTYTINLDPVGSVLRYYRQMQLTSGYNPKFSSVSITIMLDENWNFVHTDVLEHYTVIAMGVPAGCTGTLASDYLFNENVPSEEAL